MAKSDEREELSRLLWPTDIPQRVLACRHCQTRNRVSVETAIFEPHKVECGQCRKRLFIDADEPLTNIASSAYEHSLDRKALDALKAVPGFPALVRWLLDKFGERELRVVFLSGMVRCDEDQFPELVELLDRARFGLDIPYRPELFLAESPFMNAMTMGVKNALMVVYSALLDQLDDDELTSVLGHELGHLHADHTLYRTMATILLEAATPISGVGSLLTIPIRLALLWWSRCAELTADRAGLLATRNLGATLRTELKLAGGWRPGISSRTQLSLGAFIRQARELQELERNAWDGFLSLMHTLGRTHPWATWRVMHLLRWVESGNYLNILAGDYARVVRP